MCLKAWPSGSGPTNHRLLHTEKWILLSQTQPAFSVLGEKNHSVQGKEKKSVPFHESLS